MWINYTPKLHWRGISTIHTPSPPPTHGYPLRPSTNTFNPHSSHSEPLSRSRVQFNMYVWHLILLNKKKKCFFSCGVASSTVINGTLDANSRMKTGECIGRVKPIVYRSIMYTYSTRNPILRWCERQRDREREKQSKTETLCTMLWVEYAKAVWVNPFPVSNINCIA